jgi:dUTP pyrophosphatase
VNIITFKLVDPASRPVFPARATKGASGFDLAAFGEYELRPFQPVLVRTGWQIEIAPGYEAQVRARSGLALRHGVTLANGIGTIDADYRGEVGAILIKMSPGKPFKVHHGERIAQLVVAPVYMGEATYADMLSTSERGADGFGSTGL